MADKIKHDLITIQDIVNVITRENLDNFLIDFKNFLEVYIGVNELTSAVCKAENLPEGKFDVIKMVWIDDQKHDCSINLNIKQ